MNTKDETQEGFQKEFLKRYLTHGFGAMTKTEIDILVFHLLTKLPEYEDLDNHVLSQKLKATETKIKNLKLNASLRYKSVNHKAVVGKYVLDLVDSKKHPEFKDGEVQVGIEDPVERSEIEYAIKKSGSTPEYGRNREILKFSTQSLLAIILDNVEKGNDEFIQIIKKTLKDEKEHAKILKKAIPPIERAAKLIGGASANSTMSSVALSLAKLAFTP